MQYLASQSSTKPLPDDIETLRESSRLIEDAEVGRLGPLDSRVKESRITIIMQDGFENSCNVFQPTTPQAGGSPLVVLFHGGGFAVGSPKQYVSLSWSLAILCSAICVALSYRLVPEHPFPTSATDAWDSISFLASNAESKLGANLSKGFVVGGASSGGNLAAVVTQLAKDRHLYPPLTGQYLAVPLIMWEGMVPARFKTRYRSMEENTNDPVHPPSSIKVMLGRYSPDLSSIYFSPLNSKSGQSNLPRTYIQACGLDCIRDDAVIYDHILREHGVETRFHLYAGLPHGWWMFMPQLQSALRCMADMVTGIGWLLRMDIDNEVAIEQFKAAFGWYRG